MLELLATLVEVGLLLAVLHVAVEPERLTAQREERQRDEQSNVASLHFK